MFDFFRRMIVPIIMIALIGFLATIIFSWGADITSRAKYESSNLAAVINGEEVSWNTYQRVYDNLYKTEQQKTDDDLTEAKQNELHDAAWSQIQYDRLIMQEVAKYNITVSDDELYDYLKYSPPQEFINAPTFQTNGQFDYQKYMNALADPSYTSLWASYDTYLRTEIQKLKLQEIIIQSAHVTENEVKDYFVSLNEKIKIGTINVGFGVYSRPGPVITEEATKAYYDSHKEDFQIEERAVIKLVTIEKKPSREDWVEGKNQIDVIYDSILGGADFAEMAKVYSQDNTAAKGGDLGWFPQGQMVPAFDRMVFTMKKGDISPPVKTKFGWHIIKHFGYKEEAKDKTSKNKIRKAKASHILIKVVASQRTIDIANNKLNQFRKDALEIGFNEAAVKNELRHVKLEPFVRGANIQILGRDVAASDFAFESEVNAISQVFENPSGLYVEQLVEKLPSGVAPYEVAKRKVNRALKKELVAKMCSDTAAVIWSEIEAGTSFEKAAKKHNIEYEETKEFVRGEYVKGLNNAPRAIGAAFGLENIGDMSGPVDYEQGTIIIKLLKKTPLDLNVFTTQKDSLTNTILINKQQDLFRGWYENLVASSEIVNNISTLRSENKNY